MAEQVLVMGATGTVGSGVVGELARRGVEVRAATRVPGGSAARALGVPAVRFDLEEPDTWRPSLAGVGSVFLVARPGDDEPQRFAIPLIDEMRAAGVRRVVDLSAMGIETREDLGLRKVERHLEASGLAFTHLRPNFFMQIFSSDPLLSGIRAAGVIAIPAADARLSFIDARDIAAVAATVLSSGGHEGRAYTLTGPEAVDHGTVARELSAAAGREIRYIAMDEEVREQDAQSHSQSSAATD